MSINQQILQKNYAQLQESLEALAKVVKKDQERIVEITNENDNLMA